MKGLRAHLQHRPSEVFQPSELNYSILMMYNILRAALRDHRDTLRITPHDVTWIRAGAPVGQFPRSTKQTLTHRAAMERIRERDEVVRRHLRLVSEAPDEAIYRITGGEPLASVAGDARRRHRSLTTDH